MKKFRLSVGLAGWLCMAHTALAQADYAQIPAVFDAPAAISPSVQTLQLQGITKTLLQYPMQTPEILRNYLGIDTTKIDLDQFTALVEKQNYQDVYTQVETLSAHREAFNAGTFTDVPYYKIAEAAPSLDTALAANTTTPVAAQSATSFSLMTSPVVATLAGVGVVAAVAVGGGGGGSHAAAPVDTTTTTPDITFGRTAKPDLYDPDDFVDAEFNAYPLGALAKENAQYAYAKGLNGSGVKIGFYDFFSTDASADPELALRIVYRNLDIPNDTASLIAQGCDPMAPDPSICDHGRVVMGYAANARNGNNSLGVAYGASLMMETVQTPDPHLLADNGANIVNFSCSGCVVNLSDLQYLADRDILMTSASGNGNTSNPDPLTPAAAASQLDYHLIAVTGVYESGGVITSAGYDQCGTQQEFCMAAYSDIGTSFAAPQVAGAAALLKQGWSFLSADQIAKILLYSAQDIGVAGIDPVYGHGLLDIQAAVNPVGALHVLNGQGVAVTPTASILRQNQNTPFGNAFATPANAKGHVTLVDEFGRDFTVATQDHVSVVPQTRFTSDMLDQFGTTAPATPMRVNDALSLSFTRQAHEDGAADLLSYADYAVTPETHLMLGFATDINALPDGTKPVFNRNDFIDRGALQNGYLNFSDNDQVFHQALELSAGPNLTTRLSNYYSKNTKADDLQPTDTALTNDFAASVVDVRYTPTDTLGLTFENGVTHEFNSVLGTQSSGSFALQGGANTYFSGVDVTYDLTPRWNLLASYKVGNTQVKPGANSAYSDVSDIVSDSFAVTATRQEITGHDALSLSFGQPTRVRDGRATGLTQQVDHATGAVQTVGFAQDLVPTGRTLQMQLAYQKELSDDVQMHVAFAHETQPYQQDDAPAETSGLVKMIYKFK